MGHRLPIKLMAFLPILWGKVFGFSTDLLGNVVVPDFSKKFLYNSVFGKTLQSFSRMTFFAPEQFLMTSHRFPYVSTFMFVW